MYLENLSREGIVDFLIKISHFTHHKSSFPLGTQSLVWDFISQPPEFYQWYMV